MKGLASGTDEFQKIDLALARESCCGTIGELVYSGILSFMRRAYTKVLTDVYVQWSVVPSICQ